MIEVTKSNLRIKIASYNYAVICFKDENNPEDTAHIKSVKEIADKFNYEPIFVMKLIDYKYKVYHNVTHDHRAVAVFYYGKYLDTVLTPNESELKTLFTKIYNKIIASKFKDNITDDLIFRTELNAKIIRKEDLHKKRKADEDTNELKQTKRLIGESVAQMASLSSVSTTSVHSSSSYSNEYMPNTTNTFSLRQSYENSFHNPSEIFPKTKYMDISTNLTAPRTTKQHSNVSSVDNRTCQKSSFTPISLSKKGNFYEGFPPILENKNLIAPPCKSVSPPFSSYCEIRQIGPQTQENPNISKASVPGRAIPSKMSRSSTYIPGHSSTNFLDTVDELIPPIQFDDPSAFSFVQPVLSTPVHHSTSSVSYSNQTHQQYIPRVQSQTYPSHYITSGRIPPHYQSYHYGNGRQYLSNYPRSFPIHQSLIRPHTVTPTTALNMGIPQHSQSQVSTTHGNLRHHRRRNTPSPRNNS